MRGLHGAQELLQQDLTGVNGREQVGRHTVLLVKVGDLDVVGVTRVPTEADPPLAPCRAPRGDE